MTFGPLIALSTMAGRIAAVILGCAILVGSLIASGRLYSRSFFHGFMVSAGIFLSFDMILFHWVFRLHRITGGPEADVIEPILVLVGVGFVVYGLRHEPRAPKSRS